MLIKALDGELHADPARRALRSSTRRRWSSRSTSSRSAGLVERRPSPTDRRARIIAVTEPARDAGRRAATPSSQGIYADVLGSLPDDERDVFTAALPRWSTQRLADPPDCVQPVRRPRGDIVLN